MPPLPQDVAGELGRYLTRLKASLEQVRDELSRTRAAIKVENIEAQLLNALSVDEKAALDPFLQALNLVELQARRDVLLAQEATLVKAIGLVEARLG
jgi:hypothetical protein